MPSVANVAIGKPRGVGGSVYRAPLGTPLPTNAATALVPAFVEQGHVSADGVAREISRAFDSIKVWGGTEVASPKTEESVRLNFALVEVNNVETLKSAYGDDAVTTVDGVTTIDYKGAIPDPAVWVVDTEWNGVLRRVVFPNAANVTESFNTSLTDADLQELPFSLAARPDGSGSYFKEMFQALNKA